MIAMTSCQAQPLDIRRLDLGIPDALPHPDVIRSTGCPSRPTMDPPQVTQPTSTTPFVEYALRGQAPGAAQIGAVSPVGNSELRPVSSNGSFCVSVPLAPNTENPITVTAYDNNGCASQVSQITVTHAGQAGTYTSGGGSQRRDVAERAGLEVGVDDSPGWPLDEGNKDAFNDGDDQTWAELSFRDIEPPDIFQETECDFASDKYAWVRVDFPRSYLVSEVRVRWARNAPTEYATCYAVVLSNAPGSELPAPDANGWTSVVLQGQGTGQDARHDFQPTVARSAALLLYEDAVGIWSLSAPWEFFRLAEFEVIGETPDTSPQPLPDRCTN